MKKQNHLKYNIKIINYFKKNKPSINKSKVKISKNYPNYKSK